MYEKFFDDEWYISHVDAGIGRTKIQLGGLDQITVNERCANLIVAAPSLLNALQGIQHLADTDDPISASEIVELNKKAKAAIAKAKGLK